MFAQLALLLLALQAVPSAGADISGADTIAVVDPVLMANAFLDPRAAELVGLARARQDSVDHSIHAYRALARQRISVGLSTLRRERLIYRRESAAKIHWRRHGRHEIDILGAREVVPIALPGAQVPDDLESTTTFFLFDPSSHDLFVAGGGSGDGFRHPLAHGSEAHYQFESGDSTQITLPDGRVILLLELRLLPRRADPVLLGGSLWIEAESHAVVQGVFRLARGFDSNRDLDEEDAKAIRWLPGLFKPIRADLEYLIIEYGLWEMRWWLPRLIALEGSGSVGKLLNVPVRYELTYGEYEVDEDPVRMPLDLPMPSMAMTYGRYTFPAPSCRGSLRCRCQGGECRRVDLRVPEDSTLLLTHPALPPSIYSAGPELLDEDDIRSALAGLRHASRPADFAGLQLLWGLDRPGLTRYNRVEGLSTGIGVSAGYGSLSAELIGQVAWSNLRAPGASFGLEWEGRSHEVRLGAYREVVPVEPNARPFSLGNTLTSLLWGQDDGDYLRATGIDLAGGSSPGRALRLDWRLYAERHDPLEKRTSTTLRRIWSSEDPFRPNFAADEAELLGATLGFRLAHGFDPKGLRWDATLTLDGAAGSHHYLRPSTSLRLSLPLPGPLVGSVEGAGGTTLGDSPAQRHWFLGGTATLRGYSPIVVQGESFWRGRVELGNDFPAGRVVVFSDLGWAGEEADFPGRRPLISAGVGGSLLDGLFRVDLARALRTPTGWRVTLSADLAL